MTASKRIFCLMLCALLMAFSAVSISAQQSTTLSTGSEFSYEVLADGTIGITEYHGEGGAVEIPEQIDSMTVTTLGDELFWYMDSVTSVTLPETLEYIGNRVFQGCTSLTKISIPDTVAEIGDACFYGCSALEDINVPASLVYAGAFAFDDTAWITQFDGCSSIILGGRVFYKYLADEDKVVIPDGIVCISDNAFDGKKLSYVSIPDSVAFIGDFCFYNCANLKEIKLPSDIYLLGEYSLGYVAGETDAVPVEGFTVFADENTKGAEHAANNEFVLKATADFTEPASLPDEEVCVPTAEIRPAETTQQTTMGLSQGAVIAIVLSIGGCVLIIGGIAVASHFYEKKRKKENKDNQKQNSKKKKK